MDRQDNHRDLNAVTNRLAAQTDQLQGHLQQQLNLNGASQGRNMFASRPAASPVLVKMPKALMTPITRPVSVQLRSSGWPSLRRQTQLSRAPWFATRISLATVTTPHPLPTTVPTSRTSVNSACRAVSPTLATTSDPVLAPHQARQMT